jgi:hypothetical protein
MHQAVHIEKDNLQDIHQVVLEEDRVQVEVVEDIHRTVRNLQRNMFEKQFKILL